MLKGKSTTVDLLPYVLEHLGGFPPPPPLKRFWTPCNVNVSAQIVGESHFSSAVTDGELGGIAPSTSCMFGLLWEAAGNIPDEVINFGLDLNN